jgi:threonine dehydratase
VGVTLADIEAADALLAGVIRDNPLAGSRRLSDLVGGPVLLACENLQRAGSFKIRGAYTRIARLTEAERARGVVAASAGNHAQGVALAASMLGVRSTVFMPEGASLPKVSATRGYGADVHFAGHTIDQALVAAREFSDRTGAILIHPFDHPDIVAGQGTLGLEIVRKCPEVRTIVVCTGGGGLLAGVALAARSIAPEVTVVGAQAAAAAAYPASLVAGHPIALTRMATMADGIAVAKPGQVPFDIVQEYVERIALVSEDSIALAQLMLLERAKLVVEPAGAAAVAAVMDAPDTFEPPVVAVLSGGNVDPLLLMRVIRFGLTAAGRFMTISVRVPDRPGSLALLLTHVGTFGGNVIEVGHLRTSPELGVDEVEIEIQLETRGSDHRDELLVHLRELGYRVRV